MQKQPLSLSYNLAYPVLGLDQNLTQPLLLTLSAEDLQRSDRPPISLMLCIDLSGSMMGRPLELVVQSVKMLLEQLDENDRLGMVTFANKGRLISPMRSITPEGRGFFLGVLSSIQAAGSTNIEEGLRLALKGMPPPREGELRHILLLSDGQPNRGAKDPETLTHIVSQNRGNTTLSAFGYGDKHDENLLQALAKAGGSSYAYVESEDVAPIAFAQGLGSLFSTIATNIQLLLSPRPNSSIIDVRGEHQLTHTPQGVSLSLPDMIANQKVHILIDIQIITPTHEGTHPLLDVECRYTFPGPTPQEISVLLPISYSTRQNADLQMNPVVTSRILLIEVAEAWEEAHQLADQALFSEATKLLKKYLPKLQQSYEFSQENSESRNWYEQLIDEILLFSQQPDRERYNRMIKTAKTEMNDPTGLFRRNSTSSANLNTTQRSLLSHLMQKVFGVPHAYLQMMRYPHEIKLKQTIFPILGETSIGRMGQIKLEHHSVAKKHVRLVATPAGYLLIDLVSVNPPLINKKPVSGPTLLKDNDLIQIGEFALSFHMGIAPSLKI